MDWALVLAGAALAAYQAWAIAVRWRGARSLPPSDRRVLGWTLVLTRGAGLILGVVLIAGGLASLR